MALCGSERYAPQRAVYDSWDPRRHHRRCPAGLGAHCPGDDSSNSTYEEDQFNTNLDFKLTEVNRFFAKYFHALNRENQALYDQFGDGNPLQAPGWPTEEDVDQRLLSVGVSSVYRAIC